MLHLLSVLLHLLLSVLAMIQSLSRWVGDSSHCGGHSKALKELIVLIRGSITCVSALFLFARLSN